jgi:hypothetical protein
VMVDITKGGGHSPLPSPTWANFSIMVEYMPEGRCHSMYSVGRGLGANALPHGVVYTCSARVHMY